MTYATARPLVVSLLNPPLKWGRRRGHETLTRSQRRADVPTAGSGDVPVWGEPAESVPGSAILNLRSSLLSYPCFCTALYRLAPGCTASASPLHRPGSPV